MVLSYTEELMAANPRHASVIRLRTGLTADNRICARHAEIYFNSGAYGGFKPTAIVNLWGACEAGGVYKIPHVRIDAYSVYTNQVPCGHMRAPGDPQVAFAVESDMDMIAYALGMDPYEFRMLNAMEEGDLSPIGHEWHDIKLKDVLRRCAETAQWREPKPARRRPRHGVRPTHRGGWRLRGDRAGRPGRPGDHCHRGAGRRHRAHTIMRQIVAETLTLPPDDVHLAVGGTSQAPEDAGSGAAV